ncbi:hypothetical protein GXP67_28270 [Rhodocytophaga rosea]|uniref:DUF481 domain-containing protein n=1 Tax=Rhodocytophaga rosea TaxID=2704465 RepID=A0A6C0GQD5_9BACT|nr:hypothetical protein [Rhodocytophaga rosea]QHT70269.1 hypothetical protein GXP67_28270 [Rhodocytophaga rosea]
MKRLFMRMLSIIAGVVISLQLAVAQEKVTLQSGEEEMDSTQFSGLLRSYNQIIRVQSEELVLFKIDLLGPALYGLSFGGKNDSTARNVNNVIRLSVEKKFRPDWSWIAGTTIQADTREVRDIGILGGVRYYYNLNRRILKGKSANNFSANYLSPQLIARTRPGKDQQQVALQLLYGIQRRIFSWDILMLMPEFRAE